MNPFYYSPTDTRGLWIYVPAWPESAPKNVEFDSYSAVEWGRYGEAKTKALAAGIGVRTEDNGLVKRKAFCSTPYWPLPDMDEQDAEIEAWQPTPDTVYWLPLKVEIEEQDRPLVSQFDLEAGKVPIGSQILETVRFARIIHNKEKKQSGYCDQCDGVGWYEGGGPKIQTTCEVCNGTGFKPEEKKEAESGHQIHEAVKNDPIAYFASIDDLLKYDHFYRNGLADRLNPKETVNNNRYTASCTGRHGN